MASQLVVLSIYSDIERATALDLAWSWVAGGLGPALRETRVQLSEHEDNMTSKRRSETETTLPNPITS